MIKIKKEEEKYFINEELKTIACSVKMYVYDPGMQFITSINVVGSGKAKCCDEDTYDEVYGKRIAYTKAKQKALKLAKQEFLKRNDFVEKQYKEYLKNLAKLEGCIDCEDTSLYRLINLIK